MTSPNPAPEHKDNEATKVLYAIVYISIIIAGCGLIYYMAHG